MVWIEANNECSVHLKVGENQGGDQPTGGKGGGVVIAKYYLHILGSLILIIPSNKFGVLNS